MQGQNCSSNNEQNDRKAQIAVLMVPFPAQGHLNQLLHLSHTITSYGIPVHFAGSGAHNRQAKLRLHGWDSKSSSNIHFHDFELPNYNDLPRPKPDPSTHFPVHFEPLFHASTHLREPVSQLLHQLAAEFDRIIVIHDSLLTSVVQDVKCIGNAESYIFMPISAFAMFLSIWENLGEKPFELENDDFPRHIDIDEGCLSPEVSKFIEKQYEFYGFEAGRICNTSRLIEGRYVELLEKLSDNPGIKHFAIGPMNPIQLRICSEENKHKCLKWLDNQEKSSAIFISFGSTTSMTDEQVRELADGLERSQQRFIWVLRKSDELDGFPEGEKRIPILPEGFEVRIKDRGMVVRDWGPQLEILAHSSTGGFMSHCGWNSCIESISMGVPIATWPMHSEQPRNAILLTEVLKIATVVRDWDHRDELTMSITIENAVRTLMASSEGDEMRKRAEQLSEAIRKSVSDGGNCCKEMDSFIAHIASRSE